MLRITSVIAYGVGCIFASYLVWVSLAANLHLPFDWSASTVTWSFVPMLIALVGVFLSQMRIAQFSVTIALGVVLSATLLILSALYHMFPSISTPLSIAHLVSVAALLWQALRVFKGRSPLTLRSSGTAQKRAAP